MVMGGMALGLLLTPPVAHALVKKPSPAKKSATVKKNTSSKTIPSKKVRDTRTGRKKIPYILAPKTEALVTPDAPHPHRFTPEFIQVLAEGNLEQAYRQLQLEEASDKVGYMINQVLSAMGKGASRDRKITPLERGMAYHNIYLFLQRQGRTVPRYAKEAERYYKKIPGKSGRKDAATLLLAALYAESGDMARSDTAFRRVHIDSFTQGGENVSGIEYLALYYASTKQVQKALSYLDQIYKTSPGILLQWLHVGDDFWMIEEDPAFQEQLVIWKAEHGKRIAQMQRDKATHDARKKAALAPKKPKKSGKKSEKKRR
jgi:tetratricopeptide (TPR) repeat protein